MERDELTEVVTLGEQFRPFHLPTVFNLGEQRVAALERQTQPAQRVAAVTIRERVC